MRTLLIDNHDSYTYNLFQLIALVDGVEPLPAGRTGDVYLRGAPGARPTYRYIGARAATLPGGWETIGDVGSVDADGYLYLADRRTDLVLSGGSNVYPAEVEGMIEAHPLVRSCAVVGLPDDDLGQRVHAVVQAEPGTTAAEVLQHAVDVLTGYKVPRSVEFVGEPLRDGAGKVRRSAVWAAAVARMIASRQLTTAPPTVVDPPVHITWAAPAG